MVVQVWIPFQSHFKAVSLWCGAWSTSVSLTLSKKTLLLCLLNAFFFKTGYEFLMESQNQTLFMQICQLVVMIVAVPRQNEVYGLCLHFMSEPK